MIKFIASFSMKEYSKTFQYDSADDGPEVDVIKIERINVSLDIADEQLACLYKNL